MLPASHKTPFSFTPRPGSCGSEASFLTVGVSEVSSTCSQSRLFISWSWSDFRFLATHAFLWPRTHVLTNLLEGVSRSGWWLRKRKCPGARRRVSVGVEAEGGHHLILLTAPTRLKEIAFSKLVSSSNRTFQEKRRAIGSHRFSRHCPAPVILDCDGQPWEPRGQESVPSSPGVESGHRGSPVWGHATLAATLRAKAYALVVLQMGPHFLGNPRARPVGASSRWGVN